jgi:endonuclease/exonuclease/phosphatase (EEP) superfamily protein YafD
MLWQLPKHLGERILAWLRTQRPRLRLSWQVIICAAVFLIFILSIFGVAHNPRRFELASHFRVQYFWAAALCGGWLFWRKNRAWAALAVSVMIFNGLFIAPSYTGGRPPDKAGTPLKVMLSNVMGGNRRYDLLLAQVNDERPDVLVIQECTPRWWRRLQMLKSEYPYSQAAVQFGGGGIAVFSRYPLENGQVRKIDDSTHPVITGRLNLNGTLIEFLALHTRTPTSPRGFLFRNHELAWAARYMREAAGPKIIIGDLNTSSFSPYFRDLERDSGMHSVRRGWGVLPSWSPLPASRFAVPAFFQIPIDHCLVSDEIRVAQVKTGRPVGSDHLPLIAGLVIGK